jgi:hypothetical protein
VIARQNVTVVLALMLFLPSGGAAQEAQRARKAQRVEKARPLKLELLGDDTPRSLRRVFSKRVEVFGIDVFASRSTPDAKLLHAAGVLGQCERSIRGILHGVIGWGEDDPFPTRSRGSRCPSVAKKGGRTGAVCWSARRQVV